MSTYHEQDTALGEEGSGDQNRDPLWNRQFSGTNVNQVIR